MRHKFVSWVPSKSNLIENKYINKYKDSDDGDDNDDGNDDDDDADDADDDDADDADDDADDDGDDNDDGDDDDDDADDAYDADDDDYGRFHYVVFMNYLHNFRTRVWASYFTLKSFSLHSNSLYVFTERLNYICVLAGNPFLTMFNKEGQLFVSVRYWAKSFP